MEPVRQPTAMSARRATAKSSCGDGNPSEVWDHFTKIGAKTGKAICRHCKKDGISSTEITLGGSLWNHNRRFHWAIFETTQYGMKWITDHSSNTGNAEETTMDDSVQITKFFPAASTDIPQNISKTGTIEACFARASDPAIAKKWIAELHRIILNMVISSNSPFAFVENKYFLQLISFLLQHSTLKGSSSFVVPKRRFFSDQMLPNHVDEVVNGLTKKMQNCFIAITVDCWSKNSIALLSVTGHFVMESYKRYNVVLAAAPLHESHKGIYLAERIDSVLAMYGIDKSRLVAVTRDGAPNMRLCSDIVGAPKENPRFMDVRCANHLLQLVINEKMFKQDPVKSIVVKAKKISFFFRKSTNEQQKWTDYQAKKKEQNVVAIPGYTVVRWNSLFHLLDVVFQKHDLLQRYDRKFDSKLDLFSEEEMRVMSKLLGILEQFERFTRKLSEADATLSLYIPLGKELWQLLDDIRCDRRSHEIIHILTSIIHQLEDRFADVYADANAQMATLLDPRWKYDTAYFEEGKWKKIESNIIELAIEICPEAKLQRSVNVSISAAIDCVNTSRNGSEEAMDQNADSDEDELPVAAPISRKRYVDDWNFGFRPLFGSAKRQREKEPAAASNSSTNKSFEDILQDELRIYKAMPSIDAEDDVFQWYQVNGKSFPNLAYIARRFLCVPPSSVDSERNFSVSSMLYGNRCRSRLAAEKAEQIMLLKSALFRNDDDVDEFAELSEIFRALTEADDDVCIMD